MTLPEVDLQRLEEFQIDSPTHRALAQLLQVCFPGYPKGRSYYKQVPSFRFLLHAGSRLVGQLGVEHRVIHVGDQALSMFGIIDLCIHPEFQHRRLATWLLMELETLGQVHDIDVLVLVTRDQAFYQGHGFFSVPNDCRWVVIQAHRTFGIAHRPLGEGLMVKPLGDKPWPRGTVDFLGPMF